MTPNVSLSKIALFSSDIDKLANFYNTLGLNLVKSVHGWGPNYNYLDILERDGQKVFFEIHETIQTEVGYVNLGFHVENLPDVLIKLIEMGVEITRPSKYALKHIEAVTFAVVLDPDKRFVQLNQVKK